MPPCPSKELHPKNRGSSSVLTSEENMAKMEENKRLKKKNGEEKAARKAKAKAKLQKETTSKNYALQ